MGKLDVLVVDDASYTRRLFRHILHQLGVVGIREARNIDEAMIRLDEQTPDLVIVEYQTPLVNGVTLTKWVRNDNGSPNHYTPIIMMSAYSEELHVCAARDAGAHSFLAKPVSVRTVYSHISKLVSDARPFVKAPAYFGPDRRTRAITVNKERRSAPATLPNDIDPVDEHESAFNQTSDSAQKFVAV